MTVNSRSFWYCWLLLPAGLLTGTDLVFADPEKAPATSEKAAEGAAPVVVTDEKAARSTAVALNYCRASFHRMRKNPSKRVLSEEQHHILNNLNLNEIGDQEVITLYTATLDEIGKERIADKERYVLKQNYKHQVRRQVLSNAFVLGAEVTTFQYVNAVRTGANSWWDYRTTTNNRDLDLWKVEKTRMTEVNDKSSKFLDTFWKMAQKKNIPDNWLVRGDDLDKLDAALAETNAETRLRVLQRMERFMTSYPPYYYHVARTQQAQGLWANAEVTYEKLAKLGHGHFRKDEMLAAGLANLAVIQAYLKNPEAPQTARRALEYSTGAWQANLVCARILQDAGQSTEAEEAILRNLDVDLERPQSLASLVSLYQKSGNEAKLITTLSDPQTLTELPATALLQSVATLGVRKMPPLAMQQLVTSLYAYDQASFGGRTQLVCVASPAWNLERADTLLIGNHPESPETRGVSSRGQTQLYFSSQGVQIAASGEPELVMEIRYPESQPIRLHLKRAAWSQDMLDHVERQAGRAGEVRDLLPIFAATRRRASFVVSEAEFGEKKVALWDRRESVDPEHQQLLVDQQKAKPQPAAGQAHGASKVAPVTIESVTPIAPLVQEKVKPETKPKVEKPEKPVVTAKPLIGVRPSRPVFRPPAQLSEDIEPIDDEEDEEFQ
ncbi:MAG: hypothetical protein JWN70_2024 [Planctomycetaceae bacterium]|nr:hypothetical protein [Planctomycetaceae bacterium]